MEAVNACCLLRMFEKIKGVSGNICIYIDENIGELAGKFPACFRV
jgi:hypothetical protein